MKITEKTMKTIEKTRKHNEHHWKKMNNIQLNKWKNIEQTMKVMNIHEKVKMNNLILKKKHWKNER